MSDRVFTPANEAAILAEALPYIKRFHGKTIVVKYGGNAMTDEHLKQCFARDVVLLKLVGMNVVVVHGGGPQIESLLGRVGKKGKFIQGMRVTDAETMDIVEMVLGGQVNKDVVNLINQAGGKAVGLTGKDGSFIRAKKLLLANQENRGPDRRRPGRRHHADRPVADRPPGVRRLHPGRGADRRRQGRRDLQHQRRCRGRQDRRNPQGRKAGPADQYARCPRRERAVDHRHDAETDRRHGCRRHLSGGMLPKISSALDAARNGVKSVHIIDGRVEHALLLEILTDHGVGTMIKSH
jgi:acetylglutamate kinase